MVTRLVRSLHLLGRDVGGAHTNWPRIWVYTVCLCHFIRYFGVRNFRTFSVHVFLITDNAASKSMKMFEEVAEMVKGKGTLGYVDCR